MIICIKLKQLVQPIKYYNITRHQYRYKSYILKCWYGIYTSPRLFWILVIPIVAALHIYIVYFLMSLVWIALKFDYICILDKYLNIRLSIIFFQDSTTAYIDGCALLNWELIVWWKLWTICCSEFKIRWLNVIL